MCVAPRVSRANSTLTASSSMQMNMLRMIMWQTVLPDTATGPTLPRELATITTDTGAFAPGHRDWSRYTTLEMCLAAVVHTRDVLRRSIEAQAAADLLSRTPERDTLPREAVQIARACGRRFTLAQVAPKDLDLLFTLALYANDDSLAHATWERRVAAATTDSARAEILSETLQGYLAAEPARLSATADVVDRLDALGPSALMARLRARYALQTFCLTAGQWACLRHAAEQSVTLAQDLPTAAFSAGGSYVTWAAFQAIARQMMLHAPDSVPVLAKRLRQFATRPGYAHYLQQCNPRSAGCLTMLAGPPRPFDLLAALDLGSDTARRTVAPQVQAAYWFPAAGRDTVHPAPGMVSIVVQVPANCFVWIGLIEGYCDHVYAAVRSWLATYGAEHVDVTMVVTPVRGQFEDDPMSSADAARRVRWFFQTHLRLPVTVAVRPAPVEQQMPAPDRRWYNPHRNRTRQGFHFDVLDRAGHAWMAVPYCSVFDLDKCRAVIDALLAGMLQPPPTRAATTPPTPAMTASLAPSVSSSAVHHPE
jgi:hypothetical protein